MACLSMSTPIPNARFATVLRRFCSTCLKRWFRRFGLLPGLFGGRREENQKAKGKRQKSKIKRASLLFLFLPFAFCLLPFDFLPSHFSTVKLTLRSAVAFANRSITNRRSSYSPGSKP